MRSHPGNSSPPWTVPKRNCSSSHQVPHFRGRGRDGGTEDGRSPSKRTRPTGVKRPGEAAFLFSEGAIARSELEMASLKEAEAQAAFQGDPKQDTGVEGKAGFPGFRGGRLQGEVGALLHQESLRRHRYRPPGGPGNLARPGEALFTVEDRSGWRVIFRVPQEDLGLIKIGQTLSGSFGRSSIKGRVDRVSPSVDAARGMGRVERRSRRTRAMPRQGVRAGSP